MLIKICTYKSIHTNSELFSFAYQAIAEHMKRIVQYSQVVCLRVFFQIYFLFFNFMQTRFLAFLLHPLWEFCSHGRVTVLENQSDFLR